MAQFLSEEWIEQAHKIYDEFQDRAPKPPQEVQINLNVKSAPFGDGTVMAHLDTTGDEVEIDVGHLEAASATVTTDYETAKAIFVDQNQSMAMQAFMSGKIQISGDMTKVMALMQNHIDPVALEISERLKSITD